VDSSPAPLRLTDRDREMLGFLAEHRFALAGQLGRVIGTTPAAAGRRLGTLRGAGLVRAARPLRHDPSAWALTRRGLAACGSRLGLPRAIDLASYRHDVGVGWLAAGARDGTFGELSAIVSERTMRSEDRRADRPGSAPRHGVRLGHGAPERLHYPDLVVTTGSGHRVAFELELSTKSPRRRERILSAYASDPRIDVVVYLVPTRAAGDAIARSASRVGASQLVRVQRFSWAGGRAPGEPARAAAERTPTGRTPTARGASTRAAEAGR
jgi:DNA-binding transcriptional ArsR family regulator